jgi:hypothetical protein
MRGAPQSGLAREIFLIKAMIRGWMGGRPWRLGLERRRQYPRKARRCQATTVSGLKSKRGERHFFPVIGEEDPEFSVRIEELWAFVVSFYRSMRDCELVTKGEVFKGELTLGFEIGNKGGKQDFDDL